MSLIKATQKKFNPLNCVLLVKKNHKQKLFGIPDQEFTGLENRPNMITKMPIRLTSLSQLNLHNRKTLWDIGFCTGSISIEAKTQFPHLTVIAFEKREACDVIFDANVRKHSTPGITKVIGDYMKTELNGFASPDAVFIGGHGNRLEELMQLTDQHLLPGGRIVLNAVKDESKKSFLKSIEQLKYNLLQPMEISLDQHNAITILTAEKR